MGFNKIRNSISYDFIRFYNQIVKEKQVVSNHLDLLAQIKSLAETAEEWIEYPGLYPSNAFYHGWMRTLHAYNVLHDPELDTSN